jgi:hypothetical protein
MFWRTKTLVYGFHLNVPEWRGDCPEKYTGESGKGYGRERYCATCNPSI